MSKYYLLLLLCILFNQGSSQDTMSKTSRYCIDFIVADAAVMGTKVFSRDKADLDYMCGIIIQRSRAGSRYTQRGVVNYATAKPNVWQDYVWVHDNQVTINHSIEFKIGVGWQWQFLEKQPALYIWNDIYYRLFQADGNYYIANNDQFTVKSNSLQVGAGFGARGKLFRSMSIFAEAGYWLGWNKNNLDRTINTFIVHTNHVDYTSILHFPTIRFGIGFNL